MDEHRTLDEFLGGRSRDAESRNDDVESDEEQPEQSDAAVDSRTGPDGVEPTIGTYRWTPDGAACASCGTSVERRWRDGDAFVCADCKEW
jgi:hypothetical protein